jgi:hypothetical protein
MVHPTIFSLEECSVEETVGPIMRWSERFLDGTRTYPT